MRERERERERERDEAVMCVIYSQLLIDEVKKVDISTFSSEGSVKEFNYHSFVPSPCF